jgi:undecaprenyl pyrophosphate synthase
MGNWFHSPSVADFLDNGPEIGPEIRKRFQKSYFRNFCRDVLKTGPIPRHVAIIMDGNRRFARKMHLSKVAEGHAIGFEKLAEVDVSIDVVHTELTVTFTLF